LSAKLITLVKGKYYRLDLIKKINLVFVALFFYFFIFSYSHATLQEKIISKLEDTETLTFDFIQKIADKEEIGNCYIKYPLLMRCDYENLKGKSVISNGRTVAIIKKKYKKIYYYPIKSTPLITILEKNKILNLIKNNKPSRINLDTVEYKYIQKNNSILKIFFDKNSFELKGWETKDAYSNLVSFLIINLEINLSIKNDFFKIPLEKDL